ncbi:hypothetical protein AMAG_01644 [Allomyces macrogynus ATCC 38327]|uniref:Uncharacterized protein n=1 Tax=Allomyces macrogynus (strain ATCC 38327) TaxID=578462 RepID=A0A0L0RZB1_ALLM3|nr:hypothetical protein AMAG_01644 [Allomyces macrogynus ATCC 38327]|eukprot:KNE55767.1 hypothetical protein AMAG_01644 [Allomyces macrogynus ATCC 38327]
MRAASAPTSRAMAKDPQPHPHPHAPGSGPRTRQRCARRRLHPQCDGPNLAHPTAVLHLSTNHLPLAAYHAECLLDPPRNVTVDESWTAASASTALAATHSWDQDAATGKKRYKTHIYSIDRATAAFTPIEVLVNLRLCLMRRGEWAIGVIAGARPQLVKLDPQSREVARAALRPLTPVHKRASGVAYVLVPHLVNFLHLEYESVAEHGMRGADSGMASDERVGGVVAPATTGAPAQRVKWIHVLTYGSWHNHNLRFALEDTSLEDGDGEANPVVKPRLDKMMVLHGWSGWAVDAPTCSTAGPTRGVEPGRVVGVPNGDDGDSHVGLGRLVAVADALGAHVLDPT